MHITEFFEKVEKLGSSFGDARLAAPGTLGYGVHAAESEDGAQAGGMLRPGRCRGLLLPQGIQHAFEAALVERGAFLTADFPHQPTYELVREGVQQEFVRTMPGVKQRIFSVPWWS